MGWDIDWVSAETDFHRDLGYFCTEEELKPFLESGQIPLTVTQNAEMCGTDAAGYVAEGPGLSVFALEDGDRLRDIRVDVAGPRGTSMAYYALLDRTPEGTERAARRAALDQTPRLLLGGRRCRSTQSLPRRNGWPPGRSCSRPRRSTCGRRTSSPRRRRDLPWVPVEKEYSFDTPVGTKSLAELFDGRSQLLVYHFMFGFGYRVDEQNPGCTGCSFAADHFDSVAPAPERA